MVFKIGAGGAPTGVPKAPKGGARGTTPPESERNPAEGGCFASVICSDKIISYHILIRGDIRGALRLYCSAVTFGVFLEAPLAYTVVL